MIWLKGTLYWHFSYSSEPPPLQFTSIIWHLAANPPATWNQCLWNRFSDFTSVKGQKGTEPHRHLKWNAVWLQQWKQLTGENREQQEGVWHSAVSSPQSGSLSRGTDGTYKAAVKVIRSTVKQHQGTPLYPTCPNSPHRSELQWDFESQEGFTGFKRILNKKPC